MPKCGSQVILCDLPVRFDTYDGCTHGCEYCFARKFTDISQIKPDESADTLLKFINGKRGIDTAAFDWGIPLHWGGLSDPFQPAEKKYRRSYEALKVFKETQYPFVVSTKGKLAGEPEYLKLLSECNCVVQISAVPTLDKYECGSPSFNERLAIAGRLHDAGVKRVIIRVQPYLPHVKQALLRELPNMAKIGVYGIILEGYKATKKMAGMVQLGVEYVYPKEKLKNDFEEIRSAAHANGLRFFCGENRLRNMGDDLCCCGIEGMEGFKPNTCNLNHIYHEGKQAKDLSSKAMKERGKGVNCFRAMRMSSVYGNYLKGVSFEHEMENWAIKPHSKEIFGIK